MSAASAGHAARRVARGAQGSRDRVPHAHGVPLGARLRGARALHLPLRVGRVGRLAADRAPGVLWVVLVFSALLGLQRSFGVEEHERGIDALLVSPISRESIYLGKAIGNLVFLCAIQVVAIPALVLFYNLPLGRRRSSSSPVSYSWR